MKACRILILVGFAVLSCGPARAAMTLTMAGSGAGFSLSTFASGFPNVSSIGPLGIAFPSSGGVMVTDYPGNVRVFATDTDNQSAGSFAPTATFGFADAVGLASSGGKIYMTEQASGNVVQLNNDGTFNHLVTGGLFHATGIATNPTNGHLFVSTYDGANIWDVDPLTGLFSSFKSVSADGLSTDGSTLYAETSSSIIGYRISDGAIVFNSGFIGGGPDGTALGTGSLAGNIFVNTNAGELIEINLTTNARTTLATGGSRGDFVTVDPNGTLLLTQSDSILRLTAPDGGGFDPGSVPEPASLIVWSVLGIAGVVVYRRRRKAA